MLNPEGAAPGPLHRRQPAGGRGMALDYGAASDREAEWYGARECRGRGDLPIQKYSQLGAAIE